MSRAQWLAFGAALSVAGCGSGTLPEGSGSLPTKEVTLTTGDGGKTEIAVCATRSGYFPCGKEYCDSSIQVCVDGACQDYAAPACGACPACSCLGNACYTCTEDGNGGLTLTDNGQCSNGGCYGAPPARLERLS